MQSKVERIEQDEPAVDQQPSKHFSKSAAVGFLRAVTVAKNLSYLAGCFAKQLCSRRLQRLDFRTKRNPANRRAIANTGRQFEFHELPFMKERDVTNFVHLVILGGHPENRDSLNTLLGQLPGNANSGDGFVDRVRGSAKQAGLLSRYDRHRTLFQAIEIREGRRSRAKK